MADAFMHSVDNGLSIRADLIDVLVEIENPIKRLRRRRNVVALGAKYDDRRPDVAKVQSRALARLDPPGCEIVPDEQLVDDELDFLGIEVDVAAPPAFEPQIAGSFRVNLAVKVVLLGPERVGWIEVLEILHQPRPIESSVT